MEEVPSLARDDTLAASSLSRPRAPRFAIWTIWLGASAIASIGLRHYRVDNDLGSWSPALAATGPVRSYAVVGFPRDAVDERSVTDALCHLPSVAFCVDPQAVKASGHLLAVTPDDFVVGPSGDYAGLFLFPQKAATDEVFIAEIERALDGVHRNHGSEFNLGGPAAFHVALNRANQQRLTCIMFIIFLVGTALMWWLTGSAPAAAATCCAITLSQVVLVGGLSWINVPMDVSVSMVPPLMMSFGFSYAAHRALRHNVGEVLAWCGATTALGFATFVFVDVPPIRLFALSGVIGLAVVWVAVMTLVPGPRATAKPSTRRQPTSPWIERIWSFQARHSRPVILAAVLTVGLAVLLASRLQFENNPLNYFRSSDRLVVDMKTLDARLTGMLSAQWSVNGQANPMGLIEKAPGVRKIIDVTPLVGDGRRHLWCLADNDALRALAQLNKSLRNWAAKANVDVRWEGVAAQLDAVATTLTRGAAVSLPTMALVVGAVIGVRCRSIPLALASIWVNLFPVAALITAAGVIGWKLDLPSLMVAAIAMGMAVDDTLQIVFSFESTGSLRRAMEQCLRASAGSSLVAAACLSCFAISDFAPVRQFGLLLAIAALLALLANFVLLPAIWPNLAIRRDK